MVEVPTTKTIQHPSLNLSGDGCSSKAVGPRTHKSGKQIMFLPSRLVIRQCIKVVAAGQPFSPYRNLEIHWIFRTASARNSESLGDA